MGRKHPEAPGHTGRGKHSPPTGHHRRREHPEASRLLGRRKYTQAEQTGFDAMSGLTFGKSKKNFDEIDRTGFGRFVRRPLAVKKNFDEIDNVGFRGFY